MKTITLSNEVMVSDPCYEVGTWCQHKLTNQVIEMIREMEMMGDVCGVCGKDNVEGESCNCKHIIICPKK